MSTSNFLKTRVLFLSTALSLALALAAGDAFVVADAPTTPQLRFTFIGNMAFHVTDGETVLLTDFPYEPGYSGYMKWQASGVPPVKNGLVLITHRHRDHFAAEMLGPYDVTVTGPAEVLRLVQGKPTLPLSEPLRFRGIEVQPRPTPHAGLEHFSYVVVWRGLRLYFTGDTEDPTDLLAARDLDAAFVSPWLLGAVKGARIDAKRVIIYHHEESESVAPDQDRHVPRQGETMVLDGR
jgi:L-ascorbate metabolism protein UlaG (beta-lactamase superfamily)